MTDVALSYSADRGWHVFPLHDVSAGACSCGKPDCTQGGKHPRTAHGVKDATRDPAQIATWWAAWPNANIGVATGPQSGVWMLGPDGEQGRVDFAELVEANGPIPATARAVSGSGGLHIYFKYPADGRKIRNRKNLHWTKIDVRAHGDGPGYFVAPGSRNANGEYTWIDDRVELADAPDWLLDWATRDEVRSVPPPVTPPASAPRPAAYEPAEGNRWSVAERAIAYLDRMPAAVSGQRGHDALFAAARAVVYGFDLGPDVGYQLLQANYNGRCLPPWPDKDLMRKCREADVQPFSKPRGYLANAERDDWEPIAHPVSFGHPAPATNSSTAPAAAVRQDPPGNARRPHESSPPPMIGFSGPPEPLPTSMPVPPFPVDVFPPAVANFITAASEALAAPAEYVAIPVLGVLSVAVGRSRQLQVKPSYFESASLYLANVATPGAKKSPSLSAAIAPLHEIERQWRTEFSQQMEAYDTDAQRYAEDHKEWKRGGCDGDPPVKPVKPVCRQATIDDATAEAVAKVLHDNERGIGVVKDELTAMIRSMNAYRSGKGADRELYLSAWSGAMLKVNRAKDHGSGPMIVPHPFVTVFGMLTPSSLAELRGDTKTGDMVADGFFERFLMSFPPPAKAVPEQWRSIPDHVSDQYTAVVKALMEVELRDDGNGRRLPNVLFMGDDARTVWEEFTAKMADAMNNLDEYDPERGILSKLTGYGARLALLLWCARKAAGDPGFEYGHQHLDADTLRRAIRLVDYFTVHGRKAMGGGWKEKRQRLAERILRWLERHPEIKLFTRSMAYHAIKDRRDVVKAEAVNEPLAMLVDHLFIRPFEADGGRPGPKPENYMVNPAWVRGRTAESDVAVS